MKLGVASLVGITAGKVEGWEEWSFIGRLVAKSFPLWFNEKDLGL